MMIRKKINKFIIGYSIALVVLAFVGYGVGDYTAQQQEQYRLHTPSNRFASDVSYVELPRMNMSLASNSGQAGRIRIDITLEVEKKYLGRFEDFQPIITDRLTSYVRKLDMEEVSKPNAVPTLRRELLKEVNSVSYPMPVLDVVFRQFVLM